MKLHEIKQALDSNRIRLTKSLGQNFLHDGNQLLRIVKAAELNAEDRVLEIGPGLGPLTQRLLEQGPQVLALEKDRRLYEVLKERFSDHPRLTLVQADALEYLKNHARDWSDWKLVANLPYSVASPILIELARAANGPRRIVVTLQAEVAQRLLAPPGGRDYGILSLLIQCSYLAGGWFRIPAGCFFPAPVVDSACVTLLRRARPMLSPGESVCFEKVVKRGFSQRRKMMFKLLKQDWPVATLEGASRKIGLSPQVRAEEVSLEQFVALSRRLACENEDSV